MKYILNLLAIILIGLIFYLISVLSSSHLFLIAFIFVGTMLLETVYLFVIDRNVKYKLNLFVEVILLSIIMLYQLSSMESFFTTRSDM